MRNLKKVLSLALAMVMLLGMMVVGAGAATSFKDDSDIPENREVAVAVANAIEVLLGDENGNFKPDATLTRAEAAVVLTKLDLGAEAAKALVPTDAASFDDVGTGYGWAKAYIDYCAGNEYMIGVGGNRFAPAQTLTSVEFGLMVSRVLGYRDANEGITGDAWMVKAAAVARKAGLGTDLAVGNTPMTRADMAQMVLNALQAPMVEYNGLNISGDIINVSSPATVRTHTGSTTTGGNSTYDGKTIVTNITPIRLCEEKFPYLKLRTTEEDNFGHTAAVWKYRNAEIIGSETTIPADITITGYVNSSVADWARIKDLHYRTSPKAAELFINGKETALPVADKDYATDMAALAGKITGNGRQVEIYLNEADLTCIDKIVVIDTALAEVTKVVDSEETISVKLVKSAVTDGNVVLNTKTGFGEFNKGDLVLVQGYSTADTVLNAKTTITSVAEATKVTGFATVKKYNNKVDASYITVEGEDYYDAKGVMKDFAVNNFNLNTEFDSTLYLDQYGYIMKAIQGKDPNATTDNLVAVKRAYKTLTGGEIVDMIQGVLSNGQTVTWAVTEDASSSENHVREYHKVTSGKNSGKYELSPVENKSTVADPKKDTSRTYVANVYNGTGSVSFKSNDVYGSKGTYGNQYMYSDTVKFIFVNNEGVTVVTGRQTYDFVANKEIEKQVIAQALKDGEITAVFVESKADVADLNDVIYIHSRYREWDEVIDGKNGKVQYYGYTAYNAKGEAIDHFLAVDNDMADSYIVSDKNEDGAYKKTRPSMLDTHTMTNGVVAKANGLSGDAFVLVQYSKDSKDEYTVEGAHYDFLGRSGTKVVDLTDKKLYIESVSEINEAVNNGYRVEVAVIYNNTETDARPESVGKVRVPVTIFITDLTKNGVIPDHGDGSVTDSVTVELKGDAKDEVTTEPAKLDGLKKGDKITFTAKTSGTEFTIAAGTGYTVDGKTVTITAEKGVVEVTVNKGSTPAPAGNVTLATGEVDAAGKPMLTLSAKSKLTMWATGKSDLVIEFQAPDWACAPISASASANSTDGDLSFDAILMHDGARVDKISFTSDQNATASTSGSLIAFTEVTATDKPAKDYKITGDAKDFAQVDTSKFDVLDGKWSVVIENVVWKNAAVKYVYADGVTAVTAGALTNATTKLVNNNTTGGALKVHYTLASDTGYEAPKGMTYEVEGATKCTGETVELKGALSTNTAVDFTKITANDGWVTVTIGGVTKAAATKYFIYGNTFGTGNVQLVNPTASQQIDVLAVEGSDATTIAKLSVTAEETDGSGADAATKGQVGFTFDSTSKQSQPVTLKVVLEANSDTHAAYNVKITIRNKAGDAIATFNKDIAVSGTQTITWEDMNGVRLTEDLYIAKNDVVITPKTAPAVDKTASSFDTTTQILKIAFTEEIDEATVGTGTVKSGSAGGAQDNCTVLSAEKTGDKEITVKLVSNATNATNTPGTAKVTVSGVKGTNGIAVPNTTITITIVPGDDGTGGNAGDIN